jgi:radical SAM superfamily enzyme YgiQ (UPF0313 family)
MIELMKESNCEFVFLGLESGSQPILQAMNKAATVEQYRAALELFREYDIPQLASFIVGFPGETYDTVQDTVRFIEENRPTFFHLWLWYCAPLAPIWRSRRQYQIEGSGYNWSHATMRSEEASALIDRMILDIGNSMHAPFFLEDIIYLLHEGMSLEQVTNFVRTFNIAVKQRLRTPTRGECSADLADRLRNCLVND